MSSARPSSPAVLPQNFHEIQAQKLRDYLLSIPIRNGAAAAPLRRARTRLRGVFVFNKEVRMVKQFGTGSGLMDATDHYKTNLPHVLSSAHKQPILRKKGNFLFLGFLFHPKSAWLQLWNLLIILLMLYSLLLVPYLLAFQDLTVDSPWFAVETTVDVLFFIDILVTCNTAIPSNSGKIVTERKKILGNYMKGLLVVDVVSIVPIYLITYKSQSGDSVKPNTLVRFFRIFKLSKVLRAAKLPKIAKFCANARVMSKCFALIKRYESVTRLLSALNLIAIISHFTACMWFYSAKLYDFGPETWVVRFNFQDQDRVTLYLASFYWAITTLTTVGFGDLYAQTSLEMAIAMLWMLFGVGCYSFIMGTLSSMMTGIDANTAFLDERLQQVELFAKDTGLPHKTIRQVVTEVKSNTEGITLMQSEKERVMHALSRSLRFEVVRHMHDRASLKLEVLSGVNFVCLGKILSQMTHKVASPHEALYIEGDVPEHVFFLMRGRVRFVIRQRNLVFKTVVEGSFFGEKEVMDNRLREFTAEAETEAEVLLVTKEQFLEQLRLFPDIRQKVSLISELRKIRDRERMAELLDLLETVEIRKEATFQDLAGSKKVKFAEADTVPDIQPEITVKERIWAQFAALRLTIEELKRNLRELEGTAG